MHDPLLHWRLFTEEDFKKGDGARIQKQDNYDTEKDVTA